MEGATDRTTDRVEEMQGLHGPFGFPERLLQKVWLLGLFDTKGARLADGRPLVVLAPGRWNLLGGPDFREARLRIGDREVIGDVEVHFHAADWERHGHDRDPAYANVVLHVVLYEPRIGARPPRTAAGREIPELVLLPWLHCSLEEFAADDAVEVLTQRDAVGVAELLLAWPPAERTSRLREAAERRWRQKVQFAQKRMARLGWEGACHHTALEILGYSANRAAMLAVAERFPLAAWRNGVSDDDLLAAGGGFWRRQGARPANAPGRRLAQYREWVRAVPDWPERWARWDVAEEPAPAGEPVADVSTFRRRHRLRAWRRQVASQLLGGAVGGARLDTLIGNGLLPLLAARTGGRMFERWYCGEAGEAAEKISRALRIGGVIGKDAAPRHEGALQGMVQLVWEQARYAC